MQRVASRPEEFHLRPLTERCGSLSAHTAPTKQPSASFGMSNGFVAAKVSSCCQLDVDDSRLAQPLCSGRMTGLPRSYGLVRPCAPPWYARLVVVATWTSPLASEQQGPAVPHESPDQTRASSTPVAIRPRIQVSGGLIPEDREASGFDDRSLGHDASTEVQGSSPF